MIETGSEYQLLQHFEAIPLQPNQHEQHAGNSGEVALNIDPKAGAETRAAVAKLIDGTKFETFLEALVNIIVVIPVKYVKRFILDCFEYTKLFVSQRIHISSPSGSGKLFNSSAVHQSVLSARYR